MSSVPEFVLIEDVAKHFKVSVSTVRAWVRMGNIAPWAYLKIGNTYRFDLAKVVESLMAANNAPQQTEVKQEVTQPVEKVLHESEQLALESVFDADEDQ